MKKTIRAYAKAVCQKVDELMGGDYVVSVNTVEKVNDIVLTAVSVKKSGENTAPNYYLDQDYKAGFTSEDTANRIVKLFKMCEKEYPYSNIPEVVEMYINYTQAKEMMLLTLISEEKNKKYLSSAHVPYKRIAEDLVAIVRFVMRTPNEDGYMTITVRQEHLDNWGVSEESLFKDAIASSSKHPVSVVPVIEIMAEIMAKNIGYDKDSEAYRRIMFLLSLQAPIPLYVATNDIRWYGASVIAYTDVLKQFAEKNGDFYVFPSSIHELMLLPAHGGENPEYFKQMVCEINANEVSPEERLSDNVYLFSKETNNLTKVG